MKKINLSGEWKLFNDKYFLAGSVPGDVAYSLYKNNIISDPYFGRNYEKSLWVEQQSWTYEKCFQISAEQLKNKILLQFEGVDTFSEVYINGKFAGETHNMHLMYEFDVRNFLTEGENILQVKLIPVFDKTGTQEQTKYDSVFNRNRVFIRKAQCHFGWDWAPKFPGYGIYRDVNLIIYSKNRIKHFKCVTRTDGNITFFTETEEASDGKLKITVYENNKTLFETLDDISGKKKLINVKIENPKLWWPNGYGAQNLYGYKVELIENGKTTAEKNGSFGIREIELREEPIDKDNLGFCFYVNKRKIFARGSNWVPAECMTGTLTAEKYTRLINAAKEADFNMLRVWGGGIYESDLFYDLCDKNGIMIWQDFMFACSEIPDDVPEFNEEIRKEIEYQIPRLVNHPSIVYWCGMNEAKGSFNAADPGFGEFMTEYMLRGMCLSLDGTRPYEKASPFSFASTENDACMGDVHSNLSEQCLFGENFKGFENAEYKNLSMEEALTARIKNFSLFAEGTGGNFVSECAVLGGCGYKSLNKFIPEENQNINDSILKDRFLGNPYTYVMPSFVERQIKITSALYGEIKDIKDFCKKTLKAQLDIMRTEIVYARTNIRCNGFLNWMYDDIWPTGTWSVIDYYLEKKPAFYVMKRLYGDIIVDFIKLKDGLKLKAVNTSDKEIKLDLNLYSQNYCGKSKLLISKNVNIPVDGIKDILIPEIPETDVIYCEYKTGNYSDTAIYDLNAYKKPNYKPLFGYTVNEDVTDFGYETTLTIKAKTFVPCLGIFTENTAEISDNFFDMVGSQIKTVKIKSDDRLKLSLKCLNDIWDD